MAFKGDSIYWVEVEKVVPNPFQPRREFDDSKLQELSDSIRMYGILQPLTVTRKEIQREDDTFYTEYELIAGERRLRASKLAGVAQVPVIIREGEQSEQEKLELAIIENLQREDLNAVDRAIAFKQLAETFELSHSQVAKKVGRSREYVSNSIRLLALPEHILDSLKQADLTEGHARTLLMLRDRPEQQEVIYREILLKKLSVREVERIVRKIATEKVRKKRLEDSDLGLIELEKQFTETLGTRVQIMKTDFGGKLTIDYFSEDDLAVILKKMQDEAAQKLPEQHEIVDRLAEHTPLQMSDVPEVVKNDVDVPSIDNSRTELAEATPPTVNEVVKEAEPKTPEENVMLADNSEATQDIPEVRNVEAGVIAEEPIADVVRDEGFPEIQKETPASSFENNDANSVNQEPVQPYNHPHLAQADPAPTQPVAPVAPTASEVSNISETEPKTKNENEDDSNLYSIRNFGV